jgi:RNA polymerase sigma factor (sigma-70 family)
MNLQTKTDMKGVIMTGVLRRNVLEESYIDYKDLVYKMAWKFWNTCGGDFDDLVQEANQIFILAMDSYDPTKGTKFSTWLYINLRGGLLDYLKERNNRPQVQYDEKYHDIKKHNGNGKLVDFIDELGTNTREIIALILDPPPMLTKTALKKQKPKINKRILYNFLRDCWGWDIPQILAVFKEIETGMKKYYD